MDFVDGYDAPQFVDFDLIKQGQDEQEGDEWFDNKLDDDHSLASQNFTPQPEPPVAKMTEQSVATVTAEIEKPITMSTETEDKLELQEDTKTERSEAVRILSDQYKPSERRNALKATASISQMLKPNSNVKTGQVTKKAQTREDLELEKIKQIRKEAERNKALSRRSFKSLYSKKRTPSPKPRPVTEPVEFHFKTDQRFKSRDVPTGTPSSDQQFPYNLRTTNRPDYNPNDPSERKPHTPKEPTVVQPFKFHTDERLRSKIDPSTQEKYVSTAEFSERFERKTPPRFRTKLPQKREGSSERDYSTYLTVAKSPNLQSKHRKRSVQCLSRAEKEEKEMEEFKKHEFKAKPIPPGVFKGFGGSGMLFASCFNSKATTTPHSPQLATKERFGGGKRPHSNDTEETEEESSEKRFKALPVPRDMFSKVTGVPEKRTRDLTVPQSPEITKRRRLEEKKEEEQPPLKPLPMPNFTKPFQPCLDKKQITSTEPFSFDGKYPTKDELVEQLVKKEEESLAKKREFTAKKVPSLPTPVDPSSRPSSAHTLPEPFHLMTDVRGERHALKFEEQVKELQKQAREATEFKASENPLLHTKPFVPLKSNKPLTEINSFVLQTESRAEQRAQFEEEKKVREEEKQHEEAQRQALREAEEAEEIKELRRSLVHRAQPVHHYNTVTIQPSTKTLTCPKSPSLTALSRNRTD